VTFSTKSYFISMAVTGQASTHWPQSTQASLTSAFPSFIAMASTGQVETQVSQPVHFSLSTNAGIDLSFLNPKIYGEVNYMPEDGNRNWPLDML